MPEKQLKYEKVKEKILFEIENKKLRSDQLLPSESELCKQFQVSRITIRKAIDELVLGGYLYRVQGKGCFVRQHEQNDLNKIYSFTESILHAGKVPSKKQLSVSKKTANEKLARKLNIDDRDEVFVIQCLYKADNNPYSLNTAILPVAMFPKLDFFNYNDNSLYEVLKSFYNLSISRVRQQISAVNGSEEINTILGIEENGMPLLKIDAVSYCLIDNQEKPFEVYEAYMLTNQQSYYIEKYN